MHSGHLSRIAPPVNRSYCFRWQTNLAVRVAIEGGGSGLWMAQFLSFIEDNQAQKKTSPCDFSKHIKGTSIGKREATLAAGRIILGFWILSFRLFFHVKYF